MAQCRVLLAGVLAGRLLAGGLEELEPDPLLSKQHTVHGLPAVPSVSICWALCPPRLSAFLISCCLP